MSTPLFDLSDVVGPVYFSEYAKADTCCGCGRHVTYGTPGFGYPDVNYQVEGWTIRCRDCREKVGWVHPGVYWAGPEYAPRPEWSGDCPVIRSATKGVRGGTATSSVSSSGGGGHASGPESSHVSESAV